MELYYIEINTTLNKVKIDLWFLRVLGTVGWIGEISENSDGFVIKYYACMTSSELSSLKHYCDTLEVYMKDMLVTDDTLDAGLPEAFDLADDELYANADDEDL